MSFCDHKVKFEIKKIRGGTAQLIIKKIKYSKTVGSIFFGVSVCTLLNDLNFDLTQCFLHKPTALLRTPNEMCPTVSVQVHFNIHHIVQNTF